MSSFLESSGKKRKDYLGDSAGKDDRTALERGIASLGERLERLVVGDEAAEKYGNATISNKADRRNLDKSK